MAFEPMKEKKPSLQKLANIIENSVGKKKPWKVLEKTLKVANFYSDNPMLLEKAFGLNPVLLNSTREDALGGATVFNSGWHQSGLFAEAELMV